MHSQQAQTSELGGHVPGKLGAFEPDLDAGKDPIADPVPGRISDHALLVGEQRLDVQEVHRLGLGPFALPVGSARCRGLAGLGTLLPRFGLRLRHSIHSIRA
jgi:hypothetical protein